MKAGEMQSGSMNSPTSLSRSLAFVRGSLQSTLCYGVLSTLNGIYSGITNLGTQVA